MINSITIIGSGRVGTSLAQSISPNAKSSVLLVSGRTFCAQPAAIELGAPQVIVLATRDGALADVVDALAASHAAILDGCLVLHVNGSLGRDILEPLAVHGATVVAAHPFQTFSTADPTLLHGIGWGVDCDDSSWPLVSEVVTMTGGFPVRLARTDAVSKRRYHAAAVAASNFTYAAYDLARRLAEDVNLPVADILAPIMRQTLENAITSMRSDAPFPITGPLVRGDMEAVQRQLDAMPEDLKEQYVHLTNALKNAIG